MLLNNKCIYLGVSLFSALILGSMTTQSVKADTTTDTATTVKSSPTSTNTSSTAKVAAVNPATTSSTNTTSVNKASATTESTAPVQTATAKNATNVVTQPIPAYKTATVAPVGTTNLNNNATGATSNVTSTQPVSNTTTPKVDTPVAASATASPSNNSSSSSGGVTFGGYTIPTDTPTKNNTPNPAISATTPQVFPKVDYSLPTTLTATTPVPVSDPNLAAAVKTSLGIPATSPITVGDIQKQVNSVMVQVNNGTVENLNGLQYMQLLPNNLRFGLSASLASDPTANPDLTPLYGLKISGLDLIGDFSDPSAKEIDVNQIAKLQPASYGMSLSGDKDYDGLTNAQLKVIAPWIIASSNINTPGGGFIENNGSVTDFSPLKGINRTTGFSLNVTNGYYDPTPIYAVKGQPIVFKSTPVIGINGDDLASKYHFSASSLPADLNANNLKNLGNDEYELENADSSAPLLIYGDPGFDYGAVLSNITFPQYPGVQDLQNLKIAQPIIWQDHPNVTIDFVDTTGKPIMVNGASSMMVNGNKIGDAFDLTTDSKINGYTLTSPATLLKGTYTQDPQTLTLTYKLNPVVTPSHSSSSSSHSSSVTTPTKPTTNETSNSSEKVTFTDIENNPTEANSALANMGVKATAMINGKLFYQVGYGQLVLASDYNMTKADISGVVRTFAKDVQLVNAYGNPIGRTISPSTAWKYSRIVSINGADYYQVATNEYLPADSSVNFVQVTTPTDVALSSKSVVYDSEGKVLNVTLPAGTNWKTDGCAMINGVKMYRVGTDEWVNSNSSTTYEPYSTVYDAKKATPVYNGAGKEVSVLPADTDWRVDRIVTINGVKYCRVATNEFILTNQQ